MVMRAMPRPPRCLPRPHWHPLCWLRGHKPFCATLRSAGEMWSTFIFTCERCNRLIGDPHAAKSDKPVTGNK